MAPIPTRRDQVKQHTSQPATTNSSQKNTPQQQRKNQSPNPRSEAASENDVLLKVKTVFPWDLFPDTLTIQKEKITVYMEEFFQSGQIRTIPISDISSTSVETSPFFATLKIVQVFRTEAPVVIKPLKREDAQKAHDIINQLIMKKKENQSNT